MKDVISISRKTDIPAFHYKWLQEVLSEGCVNVTSPYGKMNLVDLRPENVQSLVLWSKNFKNVLDNPGLLTKYNLYFQYTITGYNKSLEPNVPTYEESIDTLKGLLKQGYKPEQFNIRFDPIILSKDVESMEVENPKKPGLTRLKMFERLCDDLDKLGMANCRVTTSFLSTYGKVSENLKNANISYVDLSDELKIKFAERMVDIAKKYNRTIYSCANELINGVEGIEKGVCIDGLLLTNIFNEKCSKANDAGQRKECGCTKSKDIGNYITQPCAHMCRYCYASDNGKLSLKTS